MNVKKRKFGCLSSGQKVSLYTIDNGNMSFSVTDFGCIITSILLPNEDHEFDDIVLGYSTLDGYVTSPGGFFGTLVGRYANRIANATFTLDGKTYQLDKNDNENCLHSGFLGYNKVLWNSEKIETSEGCGVRFTHFSPEFEQGFPGNVQMEAIYLLTDENEILLRYKASSDKPTPINFTNHSYFNLKGQGQGLILDHRLELNSDYYVESDKYLIPTGKLISVDKTPFDFRIGKEIGKDITDVGGYDHCFCIKGNENCSSSSCDEKLTLCAKVSELSKNRTMSVYTNQPGVQFYTGNFLSGLNGKMGRQMLSQEAFCLETQQFPDAPNQPTFPSTIIRPSEKYRAETCFKFDW